MGFFNSFSFKSMRFEIENILSAESLVFIAKLAAAAFAVKIIPSLLLILKKVPPRYAAASGILLSARLTLIIAAAAIGLREGFIEQALGDSIVFLALVTSVTAPTAFRRIISREG